MIPTATLPERVEITPSAGTTGTGAPAWGTPLEDVPARIYTPRYHQVRVPQGTDVVASAACDVRPGMTIPVGSLVTRGADTWEVLEVLHVWELGRAHHDTLTLDGPRPVAP